jgi:hypothetical protein
MRGFRFFALPALALLAGLALAPASAETSILALPYGGQPVDVRVGFNTQMPLPDLSEETLAAAQKAGREYLYRLAHGECALLKAVIAKTCRLTSLNVNSQIQQHTAAQPLLHINGNANFIINLKRDEEAGGG